MKHAGDLPRSGLKAESVIRVGRTEVDPCGSGVEVRGPLAPTRSSAPGAGGHAAGQEVGAEANDQRKEVLGTELKSKIAPTPQPAGSLHLTAHTQPPGVPVSAPHHAP